MVKIGLNSQEYFVQKNMTILQASKQVGIEIPRFCYHEKLAIAGNCRMCLVELEKVPKPVISCAMVVLDGMKIFTNTTKIRKIRENVLEFLLANHPLDCPICDQGGECDLQDQTILFGSDRGRFYEYKRAVSDKELNPFIKTVMTRCIHCTRCVRFYDEIVGEGDLILTGRGSKVEIGTYISKLLFSEFSCNIIDLCPVGALTLQPYAFMARPWELKKTEIYDFMDSLGTNLSINTRANNILRVLPVNEWITDRSRFFYDGLKSSEEFLPLFKKFKNYINVSWFRSFLIIKSLFLHKPNLYGFLGSFLDLETIFSFKKFVNLMGSSSLVTIKSYNNLQSDFRFQYLLNQKLKVFDTNFDLIFLVGLNLRLEVPLLNLKLRKSLRKTPLINLFSLGLPFNLTYKVKNISNNLRIFNKIIEGRHWLSPLLKQSKKPILLFGESFCQRSENRNLWFLLNNLKKYFNILNKNWFGINFCLIDFSSIFSLDFIIKNPLINNRSRKNLLNVFYLLGFEDFKYNIIKNSFFIYQGFKKMDSSLIDLFLPSTNFLSKSFIMYNLEGEEKHSQNVFTMASNYKNDFQILKGLLLFFFKNLTSWTQNIEKNIKRYLPFYKDKFFVSNWFFSFKGIYRVFWVFNTSLNSYLNNNFMVNYVLRNSKILTNYSRMLKQSWINFV